MLEDLIEEEQKLSKTDTENKLKHEELVGLLTELKHLRKEVKELRLLKEAYKFCEIEKNYGFN